MASIKYHTEKSLKRVNLPLSLLQCQNNFGLLRTSYKTMLDIVDAGMLIEGNVTVNAPFTPSLAVNYNNSVKKKLIRSTN